MTLEARDNSDGEQALKFKGRIAESPFFQTALGKNNEVKMMSGAQSQPGTDGKKSTTFTYECRLPEKTR